MFDNFGFVDDFDERVLEGRGEFVVGDGLEERREFVRLGIWDVLLAQFEDRIQTVIQVLFDSNNGVLNMAALHINILLLSPIKRHPLPQPFHKLRKLPSLHLLLPQQLNPIQRLLIILPKVKLLSYFRMGINNSLPDFLEQQRRVRIEFSQVGLGYN